MKTMPTAALLHHSTKWNHQWRPQPLKWKASLILSSTLVRQPLIGGGGGGGSRMRVEVGESDGGGGGVGADGLGLRV